MSATIYIKSNGDDDLTEEQLELLSRYSDQARVWAYLLLKEAGLIGSTEDWRQHREEWQKLKNDLHAMNSSYADAVDAALQQQYRNKQETAKTPLPPVKDFYPPETTPEQLEAATKLAEDVKSHFATIYPSRMEYTGFKGPYLTPDEASDLLSAPDPTAEEVIEKWKETSGLDPAKWSDPSMGGSPLLDMVRGVAVNKNIMDPHTGATANSEQGVNEDVINDFAQDVIARALRSYNPFKAEDTHTGSEGHEGERATFGTYLFRVMENEIKSRKDQFARQVDPARGGGIPISLTQPLGSEESLTLEETIAEKGRKDEGIDWESFLEPLRERLYQRAEEAGGTISQESIERMVDIYKRIFVDKQRMSAVARSLGLTVDRPRAKEIAVMKALGIDISKLPRTIPPEKSVLQDREDRQRIWVDFFSALNKKIDELKGASTPEDAAQLKALLDKQTKAKEALNTLTQPNTGRIHNLFWGDPRPGGSKTAIMPILVELDPEVAKLVAETSRVRKKQSLEDFLTSISRLRTEGGLNYNLLRNKIEQRLSKENPQLFTVYTYLYESDYSNPDTARMMKLSPPRITGLKKKIISTLLDLPELENFIHASEMSPLRRFMFNEGDKVKVSSIKETGTILNVYSNNWFNIRLDNGNEVLTVKGDIQKHSTLIESSLNVLTHYFDRDVLTSQCYLSFIAEPKPQLVILELRPSSEVNTVARLHINNNLIEITEFTEKYPDNLFSILKGHIGVTATLDTPFTALFEEV